MPNRIIKESICSSESLDQLSWFQECFWYHLIVNCDDFGRMDARPMVLKSRLFQTSNRVSIKDITTALAKLSEIGLVKLYEVGGKAYLYIPTWLEHQTPRAKRSKYPAPDDDGACEIICNHVQADDKQMNANAVYIRDAINDNDIRYSRDKTPTLDEVKAYIQEKQLTIDAEYFYKFYADNGWVDSNGKKVKHWKQKALIWQNHEKKPQKPKNQPIAPAQRATSADIENMKKMIEEMKEEHSA